MICCKFAADFQLNGQKKKKKRGSGCRNLKQKWTDNSNGWGKCRCEKQWWLKPLLHLFPHHRTTHELVVQGGTPLDTPSGSGDDTEKQT